MINSTNLVGAAEVTNNMSQSAPTVLYLTRFYRPTAAAAGLRADRFINALLDRGLRVIVVTVGEHPELNDADESLIVCRTSQKGRLPDQIDLDQTTPWRQTVSLPGPGPDPVCSKAIYRAGQWLVNRYRVDLIFTTGLPFGLVAVGVQLARETKLPLVAEFRDAWYTGIPWPYPSRRDRDRAREWEQICLKKASKVITETQTQKEILDRAYPQYTDKTVTIRHSYDPSIEPQNVTPPACPSKSGTKSQLAFNLAYVGQVRGLDLVDVSLPKRGLRDAYHFLSKTIRGASFCENLRLDWMSPHYLMQAMAQLGSENPDWRQIIKLTFVGQKLPQIDHWAHKLNLSDQICQLGPLPPDRAQKIIEQSDLLVLNLYGIKTLDYHWCVPGKTYTYLGSGKPILALLPAGEARDLVLEAGTGFAVWPDDVAAIKDQLNQLIRQHQQGGIKTKPNIEFIRQFALGVQQKQFADLITSVIDRPAKKGSGAFLECVV